MDTPDAGPSLEELRARLPGLMPHDARRIERRLDGVRRIRDPRRRARAAAGLASDVDVAAARLERRRALTPVPQYPADLPVSQAREDLLAAIGAHQVVVVAGETGSGKTTQLPKMCLELGRGARGLIGHTQPRRLAARAVAERIAEELGTDLGAIVGYTVRFTDQVGEDTLVKLMTDGILLAEIQRDRLLERYDTLIIDEAHERSLNIDFILGYLRQLLPRRPDLKVVITSATIDPERFSRHFDGAPIVEVSGRTYPVDVRYRPLVEPRVDAPDIVRDQTEAVCEAVQELCAQGPGDILVFLSGEREIRDTAEAVTGLGLREVDVLPLYARLSAAEQHRVFAPHRARRVVLATNVAETSLTVPGIRYVVDPGTARISRYSHRTKVQRLPIEPVSQASARQRAGRCGRVAEGICIRLYDEEDFLARPAFTDPEILRTHLASVILQMTAIGLGDVGAFPFIDPPDRRAVRDGIQLLTELGAVEVPDGATDPRLTPVGRSLAQLPVDPRLARMLVEAAGCGCLSEVQVIVAALSIQDPRERPADAQQAADAAHARFADPTSDFLAYLNLWRYVRRRQQELSSGQFRRMCRAEHLHHLRVREWQDLVAQLRQVSRSLGLARNDTDADPARVHQALLAGLLSRIGLREPAGSDYVGARGARFAVFPGSALFRTPPRWVMAAELVETSRLWARTVARIEPEWVEPLAAHLVKHSYSEPHWERRRGAVMAVEKVLLYGLPLVAARPVGYARVDPELCRELFIRHALVEGDWDTRHRFFHHNRAVLADVEELEHRARRRDIVADDDTVFAFYDARIPGQVVSGRHFDSWWKTARREQPDLLTLTPDALVVGDDVDVGPHAYPDSWHQGDLRLRLTYRFEPGSAEDGVTVHVPLAVLNRVRDVGFDWQVPGLREDLAVALVRSLPKGLRTSFVPAPDRARQALQVLATTPAPGTAEAVGATTEPFTQALGRALTSLTGVVVPPDAWQPERVPDHLRPTFQVGDESGRILAAGKDLGALGERLSGSVRRTLARSAGDLERSGLTTWDLGALPRSHGTVHAGQTVRGYPALVDEGGSVAVRVLASEREQMRAMALGTRRLLLLGSPSPVRAVLAGLDNVAKLVLSKPPHASAGALFDDCLACAVDALVAEHGGPAWDADSYAALHAAVVRDLAATVADVVQTVAGVLGAWQDIERRLRATTALSLLPAMSDVRTQVSALVYPGFVAASGRRRLGDVHRYLQGVQGRLDRLPDRPDRDRTLMAQVAEVEAELADALIDAGDEAVDALRDLRWMVEEYRISLFAQNLRTAYPVSAQRIRRAIEQARHAHVTGPHA